MIPPTTVEYVAAALGVLCVWWTGRESLWCWPVGIASAALYAWVFGGARLYSDAILQGIFVALQAWGWWEWTHGGRDREPLPVRRARPREAAAFAAIGVAASAGLGIWMATRTDASFPHLDATLTILSLLAQTWLAKKVLESWWIWIVVDVASIPLYVAKDLVVTAGLYAVFLVLAVLGERAWRRTLAAAPGGGLPATEPAP